MKKRYLLFFSSMFTVVMITAFQVVFKVPNQPQLLTVGQDALGRDLLCYQNPHPLPLDNDGQLNIFVWNIYKQNRSNWDSELTRYSQQAQLLLLQEASMTEGLREWIAKQAWDGAYVNAFEVFGESTGVLNLAHVMPSFACAYTQLEPLLRLPKSGIYARYSLSNGQQLAVINLHAINFTYGAKIYREQIETLIKALRQHHGPIIVAGDFNSWSSQRLSVLKSALASLSLQEVVFSDDHRRTFITGLPLDHVFYKGLVLENAKAPESSASDHNPLLVSFRLLGK
ncbi:MULTISPECIES: endonuclease/exonuclease/phosphatase family protein [Vibrio]|uniref:endonuclease/exonuclease/phosphatase family protein n=1 Tax=Vibrio TaxID=662 RepID=UPI000C16676F|nr:MULTISPECIES: endonuclease/exonuclease/phosphatase family protein [Vibrio]NNN43151.1 endonuclease/exonuclease/phosphatase family protein [Vibrio sp. 1-1(7)]NNN74003.1 endonuclease/exonuclease/phosphatase family protein [Vibrio sp. 12-2(3-a)]